jgi:hypothetical protein
MRKATGPVIAGNPPAEAAQPPGMNGMIVMVEMNVAVEVMAPHLCLVFEPFLVAEKHEYEDHRAADQVVIEILREQTGLRQQFGNRVHVLCSM